MFQLFGSLPTTASEAEAHLSDSATRVIRLVRENTTLPFGAYTALQEKLYNEEGPLTAGFELSFMSHYAELQTICVVFVVIAAFLWFFMTMAILVLQCIKLNEMEPKLVLCERLLFCFSVLVGSVLLSYFSLSLFVTNEKLRSLSDASIFAKLDQNFAKARDEVTITSIAEAYNQKLSNATISLLSEALPEAAAKRFMEDRRRNDLFDAAVRAAIVADVSHEDILNKVKKLKDTSKQCNNVIINRTSSLLEELKKFNGKMITVDGLKTLYGQEKENLLKTINKMYLPKYQKIVQNLRTGQRAMQDAIANTTVPFYCALDKTLTRMTKSKPTKTFVNKTIEKVCSVFAGATRRTHDYLTRRADAAPAIAYDYKAYHFGGITALCALTTASAIVGFFLVVFAIFSTRRDWTRTAFTYCITPHIPVIASWNIFLLLMMIPLGVVIAWTLFAIGAPITTDFCLASLESNQPNLLELVINYYFEFDLRHATPEMNLRLYDSKENSAGTLNKSFSLQSKNGEDLPFMDVLAACAASAKTGERKVWLVERFFTQLMHKDASHHPQRFMMDFLEANLKDVYKSAHDWQKEDLSFNSKIIEWEKHMTALLDNSNVKLKNASCLADLQNLNGFILKWSSVIRPILKHMSELNPIQKMKEWLPAVAAAAEEQLLNDIFQQGNCVSLLEHFRSARKTVCEQHLPIIHAAWMSIVILIAIAFLKIMVLLRLYVLYSKTDPYRTKTEEELERLMIGVLQGEQTGNLSEFLHGGYSTFADAQASSLYSTLDFKKNTSKSRALQRSMLNLKKAAIRSNFCLAPKSQNVDTQAALNDPAVYNMATSQTAHLSKML